MSKKDKTIKELEIAEILAAEYEYIAQTAFQAHEDRSRVTSFYLVSIGSLFGAFLSTGLFESKIADLPLAYFGFMGLFAFLSYFGYITLMQLVYLRKAWFDSVAAMNQMKEFLVDRDPSLRSAFKWYFGEEPARFKKKNVAFLLAKQVASLGAITAGTTIFYGARLFNPIPDFNSQVFHGVLAVLAGILFFSFQLAQYEKELRK